MQSKNTFLRSAAAAIAALFILSFAGCGQTPIDSGSLPVSGVVSESPVSDSEQTAGVTEDGSFTIADVLPDEAAEEAFEDIEQREFRQAVQAALAQLTDAQRDAIISEFWFGRKPDPKLRREALRALRHPSISKNLRAYL